MGLKDIVNKVKKEVEVLKGEEVKNKVYSQENTCPDEASAIQAFESAKQKLYRVNAWSGLPGINSTFEVYKPSGVLAEGGTVALNDFIKIILPGPVPENWVQVTDIREGKDEAEFTVHPSPAPPGQGKDATEIKHFFIQEASSTFRVERQGKQLKAFEIGKNEGINNQGEAAGNRAAVNTLVAEGGWAGFQAIQWEKLTAYLVHLQESKA
jgi:hypothetical protein